MNHRPRKRFGQNFLNDQGVIARIVASIAPAPGDRLIEIGPGRGAITVPLLEAAGQLDAIELDRDLIPLLTDACRGAGELNIHSADALKFDFSTVGTPSNKLRVVGNLPYNISTPLLFHLLDYRAVIEDMHFMLQKEVVDRMAARPGNKTYGRLSVMLQVLCDVTPLFDIGPEAFKPPPKVRSSFVRLVPSEHPLYGAVDPALFERIVTAAFSQRRKTLRNSLGKLLGVSVIESAGVDPGQRPEQLPPESFIRLATLAARVPGLV